MLIAANQLMPVTISGRTGFATPSCRMDSPPLQLWEVTPTGAGERTQPNAITLYSTGMLVLQACRTGVLTFSASGTSPDDWGAQLTTIRNGQTIGVYEVGNMMTIKLAVKVGDHLSLAFTNDIILSPMRYITISRMKGPWCREKAGWAESEAWMRPGARYGDITGGGKLHFRTCQPGNAQFRVNGVKDQEASPIMQIQVNGKLAQTRPVFGHATVNVYTTRKSTITFTVLNPGKAAHGDRKLYLTDLHIK